MTGAEMRPPGRIRESGGSTAHWSGPGVTTAQQDGKLGLVPQAALSHCRPLGRELYDEIKFNNSCCLVSACGVQVGPFKFPFHRQ